MNLRTRTAVFVLAAAGALGAIVQCGGSDSSPTTNPTPLPTATPAPTPTPGGGIVLPPGMVCNPTPPPLYGFKVGPHGGNADRTVLDSKPLVYNVDGYCEKAVGTSGRFCETRLEDNPQRVACDYMAVGQSLDTKRWGPTWYYNGKLCSDNFASCANHATDQFLVAAKSTGKFEACAAPNVPVHPEGGPCGGYELK